MKSSLALTLVLLVVALVPTATAIQDPTVPLSKPEILSLLTDSRVRRVSQADIATDVKRRGISFAVDEKVLGELREAGARSFLLDAVKDAAKNPGQPQLADPSGGGTRLRASGETAMTLSPLEQAGRHAVEFAENLPDFIVTQAVTRYGQTAQDRDWRLQDKLEIELTYRVGKGEQFKLLSIDGKPARQSFEEVGGSTSTGEFGSMLVDLFAPQSQTEFKEAKRETFRGRPTIVYEFKVKKANSFSHIVDSGSGQKTVAGYSGSVWIDAESKHVLRIEASHEGMPPSFPITLSENAVEYDWITIAAGEKYLLPVRAEALMGRDREKIYTRNVIEFKNYRKFEGKIKMDPN